MKRIFENIGIFIAADPAQSIHLKRSVLHIGEKRRKLKAADIERNSHLSQLLLHDGDHHARVGISRSLHGDVKAHPIHRGISRRVEQLPGLLRVMFVGRNVAVVSPALHRKNTACRLRLISPQVCDHRLPIERIRDRLPHSHITQNRIA